MASTLTRVSPSGWLATQSKPPTQMALLRRSDDRELRWGGSRPQGLDQRSLLRAGGLAPDRTRPASETRFRGRCRRPCRDGSPSRAKPPRGSSRCQRAGDGSPPGAAPLRSRLNPSGSRQSCRTISPGWQGFFIDITFSIHQVRKNRGATSLNLRSVVVHQIDIMNVPVFETKNNAPVRRDLDGPLAGFPGFKWMYLKSGHPQIPGRLRRVHRGQDPVDLGDLRWGQLASVSLAVEEPQSLVLEVRALGLRTPLRSGRPRLEAGGFFQGLSVLRPLKTGGGGPRRAAD